MTTTLVKYLQSCFTKSMTTKTRQPGRQREDVYAKAKRILSDPERVIADPRSNTPTWWAGMVVGDHGTYNTFAISAEWAREHNVKGGRVGCDCRRGRTGKLCSHMIVAEEMRIS